MTRRILTALLLLATLNAVAILPEIKFRRLDTRDGLSNPQVNCMLRDSRGYMWIGTPYGLNRYDGYRFRTFYSSDNDSTTLKNNYVDQIFEDADGHLWLKQSQNYTVYDPLTERFNRSPERLLAPLGIEGSIEKLFIDSRKNFWVKTFGNGLYYYNPTSKKLHRFPYGFGANEFNNDFTISALAEDGDDVVMVSTSGDLLRLNGEQGRILGYDGYVKQQGLGYNDYWVYVDRDHNTWVITHSKGTYIYMRAEQRWYDSLPQLLRARGVRDVPDDIIVWEVINDRDGLLWAATDHLGILLIDLDHGEMRQFTNVKGDETSLSDITVKHLYLDPLGRMWVGSYKNGVNMNAEGLSDFRNLPLGDVNTICEDTAGCYWLGTNDRGIIRYNPATGDQQVYNRHTSGFLSDVMVGSHAARDGSLWFGTFEGGLIRYQDGRFATITVTTPGSQLTTNNVWSITSDRQDNVWVGVLGGGVVRIDHATGQMQRLDTDNSALCNNWTSSIEVSPSGQVVVGHSTYYSLVDPRTMEVTNGTIPQAQNAYTISSSTTHILMDERGLIWQGSPSGMSIYDPQSGQVTLIDMKSGFYGSSVLAVTEDMEHNLWVVTDHGVSNVIPQRQDDGTWQFSVRSYNARDGLQPGPFNERSICLTHDSLVLVGGQDGLSIINPQGVLQSRTREHPRFSGLVLFDDEVEVGRAYGGRIILDRALDECRQLSLRHGENQFTIHLASDNGEAGNRSRFVYCLEGFSSKWIKTSETNPNVSFMSLSPGTYTLRVRMLADDGTVGDAEGQLVITIHPPFYRTWWAYLAYLLLLVLLTRYVWRWLGRREQARLLLASLQQQEEQRREVDDMRRQIFSHLNTDLQQPFQATFDSISAIMSSETDGQRYDQEQRIYANVQSLMTQVQEVVSSVEARTTVLVPQIAETEIESQDRRLLRRATAYVEDNLSNADISVETMAAHLAMSRVHLYKRLLSITGQTPSEFIRQIRLRHAERLLAQSQLTVAEVAYQVGFSNPRSFSKYFKELYGVMPSQYKKGEKG